MKILKVDADQEDLRKLERRTSDWKPMHGGDKRIGREGNYSGSERRRYTRRKREHDRRQKS
jgi:hypothetical protein